MRPLIIIFVFSILTIGCSNHQKRESETLLTFLKKEFLFIPTEEQQILVLLPSNNCKNCIYLDYRKFSEEARQKIHLFSYVTIDHFIGFPHFTYDKNNKLIQLKIVDYTNRIIVLKNREIIKNIPSYNPEKDLLKLLATWSSDSLSEKEANAADYKRTLLY